MTPRLSHAGTIVSARIGRVARLLSLCLFISLLSAPLCGIDRDRRLDELYHTSWTVKDGAPSEIFAIAQTIDGYLWLGTTTGLVRFDGIHFENYESPFGQAFPARNASSLLAIPDGGLWIGFSSGEVSLLKNGRITSYSQKDGLPPNTVRSLVKDRQGRIWAASLTGLSQFDGSLWRRIGAEWNFSGGATAALVDHAGTLWIGAQNSLTFLPQGAGKFQTAATGLKYVTSLAEAADGAVWMSQLGGPVRPLRPPFSDQMEPAAGSLKVFFDDQGSLWAPILEKGLWRAPHPERFETWKPAELKALTERYTHANGLTSDYAETIFQDSEGDIWVGTNAGLDRFRQSAATAVSLPSHPHMSLAPGDGGKVWVSPLNHAVRLVRDRRFLDKLPEEFAPIRDQGSCPIYRDSEGTIWMGTDLGLLRFSGGRLSQFAYPHGSKPDPDARGARSTLTEAHHGGMWVSILGDGVYRFSDGKWTTLEAMGGPKGIALSASTDPNGSVWLGFLDRTVVRIDDGGVRVFGARDGVQVGKVRCIHGHDAKAWIGGDNGVAWFDGGSFRKLIPAGGSLHDVFGILETDEGLWLGEHSGITYVPHSELVEFEKDPNHPVRFRVLGFLDGVDAPLQRSVMNPALIQSSDGLLWFATTQGLVFVDPRRIPKNTVPPPVSITSVVANSNSYIPTAGLALPARVRNLEIDYIGVSLSIPERVRYRYRLEGYDTDWQDPGARGQAFYTNPGPGSYTFRVMAANSDGVWNDSGATIGFSIAPAFYETFWFRLLCALAAGGIIWILYLLRLSRVTALLQARLGERLLERERIARDLHDTLLQSFQGLMLHLEVVNELLPHGKAKAELTKSLGHADRAIAEGRSAVYDLRSSAIGTSDLPESIKAVGDELSAEGTATFRLVVEGPPREVHTMIRDELYRITREALRNAFRHAHARHIEAEITYGERTFRLRIRDDGEGIPPELLAEGRPGHYGMPGMRERAKQIGGKFDIWSGAGAGTEIDLSVAGSIAYRTSTGRSLFRLFRKKAG